MNEGAARPLKRCMRRVGTLLLTVSGITPAASVFVMGQDLIHQGGTGVLAAMGAAAFVALTTAYVYAELASAFPITGGEYTIVGRTIGPGWGFAILGVNIFGNAVGQAVLALGLADYLGAVAPGLPAVPIALSVIFGTTLVTVLNIRLNALVTGGFLMVEFAALGVMTGLGLLHPHQSLTQLALHPQMMDGARLAPTSLAALGMAASGAMFVFNGYGGAIFFGEEMYEARTKLAWVVLVSLVIAVASEMTPMAAVLLGASDLKAVLAAPAPLRAFLLAAGGPVVTKAVSLGVAFAIVNAMIAIGLISARQLFCSGRDGVWPHAWNRVVAAVHPRFHSPWAASLIMGAATAACCFLDLNLLVMLTGAGLVLVYAAVSVAAMVGRRNGATAGGDYRMPLYPLAPVLSLIALAGVVAANWLDPAVGRPSLEANLAVMALSAAYYYLYLRRRGGWTLRGADGLPLAEAQAVGNPYRRAI